MASSIVGFALGMCITFFLTPYVVEKLGADAYGFIGLSNNLISYTSLLTVAINALSTRFVMVAFHAGDIDKANRYMCSVFFANLSICVVFMAGFIIADIFLEKIINIPENMIGDVKTLFLMLALSTCGGMLTGILGVGVSIRNRMYMANITNMFAGLLRAALILGLFGLLAPKLWYYGVTALVMTLYQVVRNCYFLKNLTPELKINFRFFHWKALWEIVQSGLWTIVTRLSQILTNGFNLLLANLFVGANAMGILSITQTLPGVILSFFGTMTGNFTPELTRHYARKDTDSFRAVLFQSLRICGFLSVIPLAVFYAYGDIFYKLWLPTEDAGWLYILSCFGTFELIFALPLEPLWQIFIITNSVRRTSLNLLYNSICSFAVIFGSMYIVEDNDMRILILAATKSVFVAFRNLTFLPLYGAKCVGYARGTFYPLILKCTINFLLVTSVSVLFKKLWLADDWGSLILGGVVTAVIGIASSAILILKKSDREFFLQKFKSALKVHA